MCGVLEHDQTLQGPQKGEHGWLEGDVVVLGELLGQKEPYIELLALHDRQVGVDERDCLDRDVSASSWQSATSWSKDLWVSLRETRLES